ncbi:PilT/PilU family type 4a pilus ATPase [Nevskia sp.]|uniref:PilT/PilU family type 4a pilus ATPase n=1 Tax=Nevskia sp. TaxID=1929292 RepID=UPI0025F9BBFF|nr:PilT/PilU family type 4a pilus ATPase [Nevskia sp.]
MQKIIPYLKLCVEHGASDIYFSAGATPMLRIEGEMRPVGRSVLTSDYVRELAMSILTEEQQARFAAERELDMATHAGGLGRFRVNVFTQRSSVAMVLRHVRTDIPGLEALNMPETLRELSMQKRGLILMVGATGSGKSTTLAAMVDHRNEHAAGHILTIEDPIEFIHGNKRSIVNQREVGEDTVSYERALQSSLREAPDVILIGEVRSRETMDACLQLANTGHLAISTLHANNAWQAMQRIVNLYPDSQRPQLYLDLSLTLRAIISQRLVRKKDGKRVAAVEVLINTPYIQDLIVGGRIDELREAMAQSSDRGMQSFDQSLFKLYTDELIDLDEALANADSRTNLEGKINFGH